MSTTCVTARTDAERTELLESVTNLAWKLVRESHVPKDDHDDAYQDAMLEVWKVTDKYDPAQAKWTTYAARAVRIALKGFMEKKVRRQVHATSVDGLDLGHMVTTDDVGNIDDSSADDLPLVGQQDADAIASDAGRAALDYLANPDANPLKPIFDVLQKNELPIFMLVAVEGLSAVQAAEQLGQKLSIVEIAIRAIVKRLQERGLLSAELLDKYRRWKEKDALNPVRGVDAKAKKAAERLRESRKNKADAWRAERAARRADVAARKAERTK